MGEAAGVKEAVKSGVHADFREDFERGGGTRSGSEGELLRGGDMGKTKATGWEVVIDVGVEEAVVCSGEGEG